MQVVCETTQSTDVKVKVAALQCLVRIMSLYYQYMETYMGPALFAITLEAMKSDMDEVALQGIFSRKCQLDNFILASILKFCKKKFQDQGNKFESFKKLSFSMFSTFAIFTFFFQRPSLKSKGQKLLYLHSFTNLELFLFRYWILVQCLWRRGRFKYRGWRSPRYE